MTPAMSTKIRTLGPGMVPIISKTNIRALANSATPFKKKLLFPRCVQEGPRCLKISKDNPNLA